MQTDGKEEQFSCIIHWHKFALHKTKSIKWAVQLWTMEYVLNRSKVLSDIQLLAQYYNSYCSRYHSKLEYIPSVDVFAVVRGGMGCDSVMILVTVGIISWEVVSV